MSDVRVSIIVPVYNKGEKLIACLESLLTQTLHDIEIICVNDCSTDNSAAILEEFAQMDSRIRVITHERNKGAGAARNTGVDAATGEYLTFVDSDDTIDPTALEKIWTKSHEAGADMGLYGIVHEFPSRGEMQPQEGSLDMSLVSGWDGSVFVAADAGVNAFLFTCPSACTKLFRREFVNGIDLDAADSKGEADSKGAADSEGHGLRFTDHKVAEDMLFTLSALAYAKSIVALEEYLYIYDQETGAGATASYKTIDTMLDVLSIFKKRLEAGGAYKKNADAFINVALAHLENMMFDAQTTDELLEAFRALDAGDTSFCDADASSVKFANDRFAQYYEFIRDNDPLAFATYRFKTLQDVVVQERGRAEQAERRLAEALAEVDAVRRSHSYRIGNALMRMPSKIKRAIRRGDAGKQAQDAPVAQAEQCDQSGPFDWMSQYRLNADLGALADSLSEEQARLAKDGYEVFKQAFIDADPNAYISYENFATKHFENPWLLNEPCVIERDVEGKPISMVWFMGMPLLVGGNKMLAAHGADYGSTPEGRGLPAIKTLLEGKDALGKQGIAFRFGAPGDHALKVAEKLGYEHVGDFLEYGINIDESLPEIIANLRKRFDAGGDVNVSVHESACFTDADYNAMNADDGLVKVERSTKYFDWRIGKLEGRDVRFIKATRNGNLEGYMVVDFTPLSTKIVDWDVLCDDDEAPSVLTELLYACASMALARNRLIVASHLNPERGENKLFEELGFEQLFHGDNQPNINRLYLMPSTGCDIDENVGTFSKWKLREIDRDYFMNCNPS